ncbi:WD40 repeat-like protein [Suillus decipiens]|nr:WD40 repeat-like protein [Suillus decipiens]
MTEENSPAIQITTPTRTFRGHEYTVFGVAVFPDRQRMVTASFDHTLRLWDLEYGVELKKMEGHRNEVRALAVSRDGQWIASGDYGGTLIAWNRDGEPLTQPIKVHSNWITSLDFSPDSTFLASGSFDATTIIWNTQTLQAQGYYGNATNCVRYMPFGQYLATWQAQGNPINCGVGIYCVRYSPSGEYLAIATLTNIQIWNSGTRECIVVFQGHSAFNYNGSCNASLLWTPDGKQLVSSGTDLDPTIRIWDLTYTRICGSLSTWIMQVGEPYKCHTRLISMIALSPTGTLLASASYDHQVYIWRLSDRRIISIFKHTSNVCCVTFSADGRHILSGGFDNVISKWAVPVLEDVLKDQPSDGVSPEDSPKEQVADDAQQSDCEILTIDTTARNACITGDLSTADRLFTQEINADGNDHNSCANRSFVMARKADWDRALDDALKSISIRPSLIGCISKGIALCGKRQFQNAMKAFDLGFMFVDTNVKKTHLLLLIKAIALFNADEHEEAILRVQDLAATCPNVDDLACQIVEAYLHVQLGLNVLDDTDGMRHSEAADHFTSAVNTIRFSSMSAIHSKYDVFVVVCSLQSIRKSFFTPHCACLVIRVGPHVLVANCAPKLVPCAPSGR